MVHSCLLKDRHVAVIRKELVTLTGNHYTALVLNQLLYWTERVKDFDLFLKEEKQFQSSSQDEELPCHGWIYKTANDLIAETLLCIDRTTMRRYLTFLVKKGWVFSRTNPSNKWDRTTQYRVNLGKIKDDLLTLGFHLPGSCVKEVLHDITSLKPVETLREHDTPSKEDPALSKKEYPRSKEEDSPSYPYTETTPKTINKDHTQIPQGKIPRVELKDVSKDFFEAALKAWSSCVGQNVYLNQSRQIRLSSILKKYFDGNLSEWKLFCDRIKSSPFLMGEGPRKWRITLDWILVEANLLKVLEGNFDDPNAVEKQKEENLKGNRTQQIEKILESIGDPVWRYWCSQLIFSPSSSAKEQMLSLSELEDIAPAKFLEAEDNKLIWVGSMAPQTLNRIEQIRLSLLSVVQKTFPHIRNIRTRLVSETQFFEPSTSVPTNINKGENYA